MKHSLIIGAIALYSGHHLLAEDQLQGGRGKDPLQGGSVSVESIWHEIKKSNTGSKIFGEEWVLVGNITFKKKAKEWVSLSKINLKWHGAYLENLLGSLYRKAPDKEFLPLQENLVSDGLWNRSQQTLVLNFLQKESLGAVNVFALVLTIPESLKETIRNGYFTLEPLSLPDQFRSYVNEKMLTLSPYVHQPSEQIAHHPPIGH